MTQRLQVAAFVAASSASRHNVIDIRCRDWSTMHTERIDTKRLLAQHHQSHLPPARTVSTRVRRLSLVVSALVSQRMASAARAIAWPHQARTSGYLAWGRRAHGHRGYYSINQRRHRWPGDWAMYTVLAR